MEDNNNNTPELLLSEIKKLNQSTHTLQLATLDKGGEPCISYTPFVKIEANYYIFVSELAMHTQNLFHHPKLSILVIEDEFTANNVFARKRLNLRCNAEEVEFESEDWNAILDAFEERQGNTVKLLRTLSDFHLFKLMPTSGTFVKGFGQAFELSGEGLGNIGHIKTS